MLGLWGARTLPHEVGLRTRPAALWTRPHTGRPELAVREMVASKAMGRIALKETKSSDLHRRDNRVFSMRSGGAPFIQR